MTFISSSICSGVIGTPAKAPNCRNAKRNIFATVFLENMTPPFAAGEQDSPRRRAAKEEEGGKCRRLFVRAVEERNGGDKYDCEDEDGRQCSQRQDCRKKDQTDDQHLPR